MTTPAVLELEGLPSVPEATQVGGPGFVTIYNTRTGEAVAVNQNNLGETLKKTHNDPAYREWLGKPAFSRTPTVKRVLGTYKCLLHPDHPGAAALHAQGFPSCIAAHIPSPAEVENHMARRHQAEWGNIQRQQARSREDEDRAFQRQQAATMQALMERLAGEPAAPASKK